MNPKAKTRHPDSDRLPPSCVSVKSTKKSASCPHVPPCPNALPHEQKTWTRTTDSCTNSPTSKLYLHRGHLPKHRDVPKLVATNPLTKINLMVSVVFFLNPIQAMTSEGLLVEMATVPISSPGDV